MDFFSHLVFGMLTALVTLREYSEEYIILAIMMAILPDGDLFLIPLHRLTGNYYLSHRAGSHSYVTGFIISAIVAVFFTEIYGGAFISYWIIGFIFYSLHVTLDLFTTSKIPIFYPFSKKEYRLKVDRAVNPFLMLTSFFVVIFSLYLYYEETSWDVQFFFRNLWFFVYYGYLLYRLIIKTIIDLILPENKFYLPGLIPGVYSIYETREFIDRKIFQLTKKVQFVPLRTLIFKREIQRDSLEMEYFNKTLTISEDYRFFSKWEGLIPIVRINEDKVGVILFLAESYSNGTAYFLKVLFDKNNGGVIKKRDGFYSIKRLERDLFK